MTRFKNIALAFALATGALGMVAVPAAAQIGVNIHLGPQPPPRREVMGRPPHRGCIFVRGHYRAQGNHWVWVRGHWRC